MATATVKVPDGQRVSIVVNGATHTGVQRGDRKSLLLEGKLYFVIWFANDVELYILDGDFRNVPADTDLTDAPQVK